VIPETANWPLDTLAAVTLIEVFPVFKTVAVCEIFLPTTRLPKLKLLGVTWIAACDFVPPALTRPEHPISNNVGASKRMAGSARCHQECPICICRCGWSVGFRNFAHPKRIEFAIPRFTSPRESPVLVCTELVVRLSQLVGRGRRWVPLKLR
jgi:hypothetical protein